MSIAFDLAQDTEIAKLKKRVARLERIISNEKGDELYMSALIKDLIGKECNIISSENPIGGLDCHVLDADDEWVKLLVKGKKGDVTYLIRIESISKVTLK